MEKLLKRQEELQKEAFEVLNKLDLLNILSSYGKPEIVGSLAAGLMTWKDIDLEIIGEIDEEKYWDVVKKIFHTEDYKRTFVIDFRKSTNPFISASPNTISKRIMTLGKLTYGFLTEQVRVLRNG